MGRTRVGTLLRRWLWPALRCTGGLHATARADARARRIDASRRSSGRWGEGRPLVVQRRQRGVGIVSGRSWIAGQSAEVLASAKRGVRGVQ